MTAIGSSSGSAPATAPALADAAEVAPTDRVRRAPRGWRRWSAGQIALRVLLLGFTLLFLYPLVWLLAASLKPASQVFDNSLIPKTWRFDNYAEVWDQLPLLHWMFNSVSIAVIAAGLVAVSSSVVAFGFAYFRFPGRGVLFGLVLGSMMLPGVVTIVPVYLVWNAAGLVGSQIPLWAGNLFGSAFYIFLLRQFFLGLPRDVFEAARVDGLGYFGLFWRMALPLSKPALIITFVFELRSSWTDLVKPLVYLQDPKLYTLPRGLKAVLDQFGKGGESQWEVVLAASVIATIPMVVVFLIAQRYFVQGISTTGRTG
jgi:multiple sugar transport system permease protein